MKLIAILSNSNNIKSITLQTGSVVKIYLISFIILVGSVFMFGCSTIVRGTSQTVSINSNVKGADVIVNGDTVGQTPYTGPIKRSSTTTVTLRKEGYESKTITLNSEIEGVFWGNIIIGGFLGSTTDLASGAMYKYAPATLDIEMAKSLGN